MVVSIPWLIENRDKIMENVDSELEEQGGDAPDLKGTILKELQKYSRKEFEKEFEENPRLTEKYVMTSLELFERGREMTLFFGYSQHDTGKEITGDEKAQIMLHSLTSIGSGYARYAQGGEVENLIVEMWMGDKDVNKRLFFIQGKVPTRKGRSGTASTIINAGNTGPAVDYAREFIKGDDPDLSVVKDGHANLVYLGDELIAASTTEEELHRQFDDYCEANRTKLCIIPTLESNVYNKMYHLESDAIKDCLGLQEITDDLVGDLTDLDKMSDPKTLFHNYQEVCNLAMTADSLLTPGMYLAVGNVLIRKYEEEGSERLQVMVYSPAAGPVREAS